jgi:hypothetical protein
MGDAIERGMDRALSPTIPARTLAAFASGMRRAKVARESAEEIARRQWAEDTIAGLYARTGSRAHQENRALVALARIDARSR